MRKYIYTALGIIFTALIVWLGIQMHRTIEYKRLYEKELQNVNAYQISNSGLEGEIRQYRMTIDELYASKDSLDMKLVNTMEELKLKDSKVKSLQYQLKQATRTDTVTLYDTIFVPEVNIDTTLGDRWYNLRLQLQYPSTIVATPTVISEQYIYINNRQEYVGGKSKCFFINWFKKKYTVTEVKVKEENPHIITINQKFIEVNE